MARAARSRKQITADLVAALQARRTVRIRRVYGANSTVDGFVLAIAQRWLLVAPVQDGPPNGLSAIRFDTILCVDEDPSEPLHRALIDEDRGLPSAAAVKRFKLSRTRDVIASAAEHGPLISLSTEHAWPDETYIGVPVGVRKKHVGLLEVTPQATWDDAPTRYRLREITRVDTGGRYERLLHQVAGGPPNR